MISPPITTVASGRSPQDQSPIPGTRHPRSEHNDLVRHLCPASQFLQQTLVRPLRKRLKLEAASIHVGAEDTEFAALDEKILSL